MVGAGCREVLLEKFGHQSGGGGRKARSDALGSVLYGVRREIGKSMPTGDIWFTASIKVINAINERINALNEISIIFGITFVLNAI